MSRITDNACSPDSSYKTFVEDHRGDADVEWLYRRMAEFNEAKSGGIDHQPLAVFLRDKSGCPHGGLLGWTMWSWLHIDTLWISEQCRGKGYGRSLLSSAEKAAQIRGCSVAEVDTFNFQARSFYEKCGYTVFGTLKGIGGGRFERYYLKKELDGSGLYLTDSITP